MGSCNRYAGNTDVELPIVDYSIRPTREQKNGADSHAAPEGARLLGDSTQTFRRAREAWRRSKKKRRPGGVPGRRLGVPTRPREGFAWPPILGGWVVLRGAHARPWVCWEFQRKVRPGSDGKFHPAIVRKSSLFVRSLFTTRRIPKASVEDTKKRRASGDSGPSFGVPCEQGEVFAGLAIQWQRRPITRCSRTACVSHTPGCTTTCTGRPRIDRESYTALRGKDTLANIFECQLS